MTTERKDHLYDVRVSSPSIDHRRAHGLLPEYKPANPVLLKNNLFLMEKKNFTVNMPDLI